MGKFINFYKLGPTKEKELFKKHRDSYFGIAIPAHIASYYSKFCVEFIGSIQKPYFIDPITYIFSRNHKIIRRYLKDKKTKKTLLDVFGRKKKGDIRRSFKKIVEQDYKSIILKAVNESRSLDDSDFKNDANTKEFVKNVVNFQLNKLSAIPQKYKKYEKYAANKEIFSKLNYPLFIIPPYFYIDSLKKDEWYKINLAMIKLTKQIVGNNHKIYSVILADHYIISNYKDEIIKTYIDSPSDGFIIWINDFVGNSDLNILNTVKNFIFDLSSKSQKDTIMLYGDYFSILLSFFGLKGFSCGICYGERKSVDQDPDISGGMPTRFYIELIKRKVQIETEILRFNIPKDYPDFMCNCPICQRKKDPAILDEVESKEHFLLVRSKEIDAINKNVSKKELSDLFTTVYDKYKDDILLSPLKYLKDWSDILK